MLIRFCSKANDPKSQNIPDAPDFWLANKIFRNNLCNHAFMHLYQLSYICFTSYHNINHLFIHVLYIFCMMNVVRMWQGNIVLRNISGVTEGVHWVRLHRPREKSCPFKGIQKWNFPFSSASFEILACYKKMLLRVHFDGLPK